MKIPLANKVKKRLHLEIGLLQDELIDIIYTIAPQSVLHGGTAMWRCYDGNRFSEDIDIYLIRDENFEGMLKKKLKERKLELLKYKKTNNLIFSKIANGQAEVRLEIHLFLKKIDSIVKPYEKMDGSFIDVFTLSGEKLILEKIKAYTDRKLIRDIYDVYHLTKYVKEDNVIKNEIVQFLSTIENPLDEENLKVIVYLGAIPSFKQMIESLKKRFS